MNMQLWTPVVVALALAACAESRTDRASESVDRPPPDAGSPTAPASEPNEVTFEITPQECGGKPFGPEWKLRRLAQCRSDADCTRGRCVGLPERECEYGGSGTAVETGPCTFDEDCTGGANGRCAKYLSSSCMYDLCQVDADCSEGSHCICPPGDKQYVCVVKGCVDDSSCSAGASCQEDLTIQSGERNFKHCTTDRDECRADSDCEARGEGCGFDTVDMHWICRLPVIQGPSP